MSNYNLTAIVNVHNQDLEFNSIEDLLEFKENTNDDFTVFSVNIDDNYLNIDIEDLSVLCEFIESSTYDIQAIIDYYLNSQYINDLNLFEDALCGEYNSLLDYAEETMNQCYEIPKELENYIDYEAYKRDLECEGYWISDNGYVFRPL